MKLNFYVLEVLLMLDLMNSVSKALRNAISLEIKYFMRSGRFKKYLQNEIVFWGFFCLFLVFVFGFFHGK